MIDFLFWLFNTPAGWAVFAAIVGPGVIAMIYAINQSQKQAKRADREAASVGMMARRDLIARTIERGDFLPMSEAVFQEWLEVNSGHIFPHERDAMVRQRAARSQSKS